VKIERHKTGTEMTLKVVAEANVEVIPFSQLEEGDEILWANYWRRRVIYIDRSDRSIIVSNPLDDKTEKLKMFMNYFENLTQLFYFNSYLSISISVIIMFEFWVS